MPTDLLILLFRVINSSRMECTAVETTGHVQKFTDFIEMKCMIPEVGNQGTISI